MLNKLKNIFKSPKKIDSTDFEKKTIPNTSASPTPFPVDKLKVEVQFCDCLFNHEKKSVEIVHKDVMALFEIEVLATDKIEDLIWKAVKKTSNEFLPNYLYQRELYQFMPTKIPTWDKKNETLEICYYHNINVYEKKWGNYKSEKIIMQQMDPETLNKLEQLCTYYDLNPSEYI